MTGQAAFLAAFEEEEPPVSWFRNMSLAKKLYGLVGVPLVFLLLTGVIS